jgi:hypothetical protein
VEHPFAHSIASRTAASPHGITAISTHDYDVKNGRNPLRPRSPVQIAAFLAVLPHPLPVMPLS